MEQFRKEILLHYIIYYDDSTEKNVYFNDQAALLNKRVLLRRHVATLLIATVPTISLYTFTINMVYKKNSAPRSLAANECA